MSKELVFIRFLQITITILTFFLIFGIYCVKKGNIKRHKQINLTVVIITFIAIFSLITTLFFDFNYRNLCSSSELLIHRCFATPLFFTLIFTTYYGIKKKVKKHKIWAKISIFFWVGSLISAWLFF